MSDKMQSLLSTITLLLGIVILVLMILIEDEPSGIAVLFIVFSILWKTHLNFWKTKPGKET